MNHEPSSESIQGLLPSGWIAVPVNATITMHNAAAFADIYEPPSLDVRADGQVYLKCRIPDWTRVWRVMVDAAPPCPSSPATRSE